MRGGAGGNIAVATAARMLRRERGLDFARAWRRRMVPCAAEGGFPFREHRTLADVGDGGGDE